LTEGMDDALPHLDETVVATARFLETVAGLDEEALRAPSVLPGWSRAHLVTHVARNADALTQVLQGARAGEIRPMYASQEVRDADIEAGVRRNTEELLADATATADRWHRAADELQPGDLDCPMARLPDGPTQPVRRVGMMRRTEVEVHHADLDAGYTATDWPPDFVAALMKRRHRELDGGGVRLRWSATDTGESWETGAGPEVFGTAADLVWWLLGRGNGEGLACSDGQLPELGRWA
jgi:maleylpyruvate isomerase